MKPRNKPVFRPAAVSALIAIAVALLWIAPASAAMVLSEGFENNLAGWERGQQGSTITLSSEQAVSGNYSLKLHYTDTGVGGGPFILKTFSPMHHYYIQYWIRFSPGFVYAPKSTKWLYGPRPYAPNGPGCLMVTTGAGTWFTCQGAKYDLPNGCYMIGNEDGASILPAMPKGQWICVEYEVDIGTRDQADGVMRLWMNGYLMGERTNLPLNVEGTGDFYDIAFYQERGIGDIYYDDVKLSDSYIPFTGSFSPWPIMFSSIKTSPATGRPYSVSLTARYGVAPYTWSMVSGSLPAGLSFNTSTATISGTPTCGGKSTFTVKVRDAAGIEGTKAYTLTVSGSPCGAGIEQSERMSVNGSQVSAEPKMKSVLFRVPGNGEYSLSVRDLSGREVWSSAGIGNATWDHAGKIKRGVYFASLEQDGKLLKTSFCNIW